MIRRPIRLSQGGVDVKFAPEDFIQTIHAATTLASYDLERPTVCVLVGAAVSNSLDRILPCATIPHRRVQDLDDFEYGTVVPQAGAELGGPSLSGQKLHAEEPSRE